MSTPRVAWERSACTPWRSASCPSSSDIVDFHVAPMIDTYCLYVSPLRHSGARHQPGRGPCSDLRTPAARRPTPVLEKENPMIMDRTVELSCGPVRYRETGAGEPIVFVHGLLVDGQLWRDVASRLEGDFRVIVPDWPLGSQREPAAPGTALSPPGLARSVAEFRDALDLERVTLVGNDTGGAICQLVATRHPERLARLV